MGDILVDVSDRVCTITLNRPQVRNALSGEVLSTLGEILETADADPQVHVLVLTGTDPSFCAGADLREVSASGGVVARFGALKEAPPAYFMAASPTTKPLIAAVNGPAFTGGLVLMLLCDLAIASERATFSDTHVRMGVPIGGGEMRRLERLVGLRRAKEILLTGKVVDATEAHRIGLVNEVVPHEELLPCARRMAEVIAGWDHPDVVRLVKRVGDEGSTLTVPEAAALELRELRAWFETVSVADVEQRADAHVRAL